MTRMFEACKTLCVALFAALMLFGCRSSAPPVEFYTLSATRMQAEANTITAGKPVSVGVGPVTIPQVLDRPQIVIRTSPNKLQIDEFHRWAGRLDEDFARVVAENISLMLPSEQVAVYPWDVNFEPHYQVTLDIRHFEGRMGEHVFLEVFWKIIDPQKGATLSVKKSVIREPLPDETHETLIVTKSKAVESLSEIIVIEINILY
ncbi:MAG: PqiC family protein [Desulfobacterales bacterium]|jgi:uncharacterized lipoprotein YmbA